MAKVIVIDGWNITKINDFRQLRKMSKKWDTQWPSAGWTKDVPDEDRFWGQYKNNKNKNSYQNFNGSMYVVENHKNNGDGAFLLKCSNGKVEAETPLVGYRGEWAMNNIISPKVIEYVKNDSSKNTLKESTNYFPY